MKYHVWCKIYPDHLVAELNIQNPPFRWNINFDTGISVNASLQLNHSGDALVIVECDIAIADLNPIIATVRSNLQSLYDAALNNCGVSMMVEIKSVLLPDDTLARVQLHDVNRLIEKDSLQISISEATNCAINSRTVSMALADLRSGALNPNDIGFYAYRAIETIMQTYKDADDEVPKFTWPKIRSSLKFEISYIQKITGV